MKKNVIFLLLMVATLSLYAKTPNSDNVDPVVEAKFKKEFGPSVKVSWQLIRDVSIATFTEQGEEKQVYYDNDGEVFGIGKFINRDLLPEMVGRSINTRFNSGVIQNAYEFKSKGSPVRYYVRLVTQHFSMIVSATEFGDVTVDQKERFKRLHP